MSNYKNFSQLTQLSAGILLMYIAFNSASNLQAVLMEENGFGQLGFYILAMLYLFMGIGSLISTAMINKWGYKVCLFIGGLGNVQWILSTILAPEQKHRLRRDGAIRIPDQLIAFALLLSTCLNGLTLGVLWASANNYVASCASDTNKGLYFSYFWTFYMTSQILGNLIAAITLSSFNEISFFLIMGTIALTGTLTFLFIRKPIPIDGSPTSESESDIRETLRVADSQPRKSIMLHSFKQDIKSVIDLLVFNKRMRMVLPELCWTGISIAVYTGLLVPTITESLRFADERKKFELSMLAMVALGIGEIMGALIQGRIIDKIGTKRAVFINAFAILVSTLMILNYLFLNRFSAFAFVITFLWGYQDSCVSIHLNSILGFEFESNKEPFSIDALIEAFMVFTFQVIQSFIRSWKAHFLYMSIVGVIGIAVNLNTYFFDFKQHNHRLVKDNQDTESITNIKTEEILELRNINT